MLKRISIATYVSSPFSKRRLPPALQAGNHVSRLYTKKEYFHIFWIRECILFERASFWQHTTACSVRNSIWSGCVGEDETSDNRHIGVQALHCCSVLQCVAVCCSVLQCVAVCCSVLQCVAESNRLTRLDPETSDNRHRELEPIWLLAPGVGEGLPAAFIQSQRRIK